MNGEHIMIDDLAAHIGSLFKCPVPTSFHGVFDGHGGLKQLLLSKGMLRDYLFFEDSTLPCVNSSCETTALTALVLGKHLLVANTGDCGAVLCRKGAAVEMSQDHKPSYLPERNRVEELGGYFENGYLNGYLAVTRALGDWDFKLPLGVASPLIVDPDPICSQPCVSRPQTANDPEQCARELVMEASRLHLSDNLIVIIIYFSLVFLNGGGYVLLVCQRRPEVGCRAC
ncbi:hypothetical protein ACFE04_030782 [Oxalis oulophora]